MWSTAQILCFIGVDVGLPALCHDFHGLFLAVVFTDFHLDILQNLLVGEEVGDFLQHEGGNVGKLLLGVIAWIAVHHADELVVDGAVVHHAEVSQHPGRDGTAGKGGVRADH